LGPEDAMPDEPVADDAASDDAAPDAPEPAPEPNPVHEQLVAKLSGALGDALIESVSLFDDVVARVKPDSWRRAGEVVRDELECDYLSFVAGIDWAPAPKEGGDEGSGDTSSPVQPSEMTFGAAGSAGRFQVFAHVQSTRRHWGITLKTDLDESAPTIDSWVAVYPGADWHERECWEMFGFVFDGHPSLRHLYLPTGFEGHPLRKDFPLLARVVKPWPGLVDVEPMPGEPEAVAAGSGGAEGSSGSEGSASEGSTGSGGDA
jgi:NADH-quinone oxidoreductase subunit C